VPQSRRKFICNTGAGLLSFYVAGCEVELTPEQARQQKIPGLAHFIDHQLNASPQDQLLMIKYLGVSPPFSPLYSAGLAALNTLANDQHGTNYADLNSEQRTALVGQMAQANPEGWQGPPAPFFYFVIRNDAIDVVYGTKQGIEDLGIPYMAHIEPPSRWGE
jgi:hypothetical protein